MNKLLNKTFVKFTIGFIAILIISFVVTFLSSYYEENERNPEADEEASL